ncbi:MAG TPA: hypothetical protein VGQ44_06535 [Gemmatimonadaceae bacterium]|nr:hypothetical protein [Gemmatimonadaceae bacterium]
MIRLPSFLVASVIAAGFASASNAQSMPGTAAKAAAHRAADATTAHIEAEQRPDGPSRPTAVVSTVSNGEVRRDTVKSLGKKAGLAVGTKSDTAALPSTIMREEYAYSRDGRRDPFYSLLATSELRPTIGDLRLTGILFDRAGKRSVATLRDVSANNVQYRVFVGSTLGRMRVAAIRMKAVIFTIDEFGTSRQDSLFLGDSTRMRAK